MSGVEEEGGPPEAEKAAEPAAKRQRTEVNGLQPAAGGAQAPSPVSAGGHEGAAPSGAQPESKETDGAEGRPPAAAAAAAAAPAGEGGSADLPAAGGAQQPDIPAALKRLGLTAKEVFSGGEQLPPSFTESKLQQLLQQLWGWAVSVGKVAADAPVTVPRLVLVAQWGLQRMRAGAAQGGEGDAGSAAPEAGEAPSGSEPESHDLVPVGGHEFAEVSLNPEGMAPLTREISLGLEQQSQQAVIKSEPGEEGPERGASKGSGSLPAAPAGGLAGALLATWITALQQQEQAAAPQDNAARPVQRPQPMRPALPAATSSIKLRSPSGSQPTSPAVSLPPANPFIAALGGSFKGAAPLSGLPARPASAPMPAAGLRPGAPGAPPRPPAPQAMLSRSFNRMASRPGAEGALPPAPHALAAEQPREAGKHEPPDMLYLLGDLTGGELAEQPAFTATLQDVLRGFDAHLAAQRVAFTYSHAELRQACTFVVRQLDAQDKHWLAQDGGELFSVLIQTCAVVHRMDQAVRELHESISRKVARISAASAGTTPPPAQPQGAPSGSGAWQSSSSSILGLLGSLGGLRPPPGHPQQPVAAYAPHAGWLPKPGSGLDSGELASSRDQHLVEAAVRAAELVQLASSGRGPHRDPAALPSGGIGSSGSGGSGGGEAARGSAAQAAAGAPPSAMAQALLELMRSQLRKQGQ